MSDGGISAGDGSREGVSTASFTVGTPAPAAAPGRKPDVESAGNPAAVGAAAGDDDGFSGATRVLPGVREIGENEDGLSSGEMATELPIKPRDRYKFIRSIGFGGMKTVLLVRDNDTGRNVAMAMLPDRDEHNPGKVRRFIQEARITARLEHPNIVSVHDIGADASGNPYFTMRYLKGATLAKILRRLHNGDQVLLHEYSPARMVQIFRRICNAIAFAHSQNVMHLDLKPENIHIGDYGDVQVIDWGLSRLIYESRPGADSDSGSPETRENVQYFDAVLTGRTLDGVAKGTPGFMAPEQAAGRNREKDERTDIYALGCILYSMLTFSPPMGDLKGSDAVAAAIKGEAAPPEVKNPVWSIPETLEAICLKAMSHNPDNRYQSVEALIDDIQQFSIGFAPKAAKTGWWHHLWLFTARNSFRIMLTIFLALIAVLIYLYWREILSFNW